MTIFYGCDQCKRQFHDDYHMVTLKGVSARSGILLPQNLMKWEFCTAECFWMWAKENLK